MTGTEIDEFLFGIICRPRMFFEPTATTRDLIFLLRGVYIGLRPPYGAGPADEPTSGFWDYLYHHFNREPPLPNQWPVGGFTAILFDEFGDKPLFETCTTLSALLRE